jgi:hypothetical protein
MTDSRKRFFILAAIFIVTRIFCFFLVVSNWSDIPIYERYSDYIFDGQTPYRDFLVEYPPLTLLIFIIPSLLAKVIGGYAISFRLVMMGFDLGNIFLINKLAGNTAERPESTAFMSSLIYLVLTGLAFQLLYDRFDIAVTFMILLSIYFALIKDSWFAAYLAIWIAVMTKIFPVILIPLFGAMQVKIKRDKYKPIVDVGLATLALMVLLFLSWLIFGPWWKTMISYHGERGIQIESMYGMIASLATLLGVPYSINHDFGSFNIENSLTQYFASLSPFITLAAIIFGYYLFNGNLSASREKRRIKTLVSGIMLVLTWFVIANKVISPQYLLWLYPFIAIYHTNGKNDIFPLICWAAMAALTTVLFPYLYPAMVMQKTDGVILLTARNLTLLLGAVFISLKTDPVAAKPLG